MAKGMLAVGIAAALVAAAAATAAQAEDRMLFARANAKAADVSRDEAECKALAAKTYYLMPGGPVTPAYGIVGVGLLAALTPGYNAQTRAKSLAVCMRHRGYARLALTDAEADALGALTTEFARTAWIDAFLAGDITARVNAALTPAAPPLPSAEDAHDPYVIGAARIDPRTIALTASPVGLGREILAGKVSRRRSAILKDDYQDSIALTVLRAPAGTIFQEYLDPLPWDPSLSEDRTAWCAPLRSGGPPLCVRSTLEGYEIAIATGEPWLVGHAHAENSFKRPFVKPMILIEQAQDSQGPLDFQMVVTQLSDAAVTLTASAVKDGRSVEFWTRPLTFDAAGQAKLPFWDRTLVLTRVGTTVTAAFEPRADGKGWLDLE